jgi:hypothetical protein
LTIDSSDVVDLQQGLERFAALLHGRTSTSRPISGTRNIVLAWDPEVLTSIDYANLIAAIADLARVEGAAGIHRVICETISVSADVGALI